VNTPVKDIKEVIETTESDKKTKRRSFKKKQSSLPPSPEKPQTEKPQEKIAVSPERLPIKETSQSPVASSGWSSYQMSPSQISLAKIQEEQQIHISPSKEGKRDSVPIEIGSEITGWKVSYKIGKTKKDLKKQSKQQPTGPAWRCNTESSPSRSLLQIQAEEQTNHVIPHTIFTPPTLSTSPINPSPTGTKLYPRRDDRTAWMSSPPKESLRGETKKQGSSTSKSLQTIQQEEKILAELKLIYGENVTEALAELNLGLDMLIE